MYGCKIFIPKIKIKVQILLTILKYLKGNISNQRIEKLVISKSLDDEYQKPFSNKPFKINKLDWTEEKHT